MDAEAPRPRFPKRKPHYGDPAQKGPDPPGPGSSPARPTAAGLFPQRSYARSVFSMMNLTFSSVSSVIRTVGWLAYGIVPQDPPAPGFHLRCATASAAAGSGSARAAPFPPTSAHIATCRPEAAASEPTVYTYTCFLSAPGSTRGWGEGGGGGAVGIGKTCARPRLNNNIYSNSYYENGCSCRQRYTCGGVPCSTVTKITKLLVY